MTSIPGCGSARRAGPIGISGEAATATATAMTAPVTVTAASRTSDRTASWPRVMPEGAQDRELRRVQHQLAGQAAGR